MATRRSVPRRTRRRRRRRSAQAERLLFRLGRRRGLEDRQRRHELDEHHRRRVDDRLGRRDRDRAVRSERHLRRRRRSRPARRLDLRRRHVSVDRRRRHMAIARALGRAAHRAHRRRPARPGPRARRGHGTRQRPQFHTRRLPHDRRRQELAAGALRQRHHRRDRCGDGPEQSAHRVRVALAHGAHAVGLHRGQRQSLEDDGRRRHLA